nr:MAG TPA: hypothetical protein [Caudoviricetes sp.]
MEKRPLLGVFFLCLFFDCFFQPFNPISYKKFSALEGLELRNLK